MADSFQELRGGLHGLTPLVLHVSMRWEILQSNAELYVKRPSGSLRHRLPHLAVTGRRD